MSEGNGNAEGADTPGLAALRHDLRTPIGHILGYGEMVLDDLRERGLDDLAPDVEKMRRAGEHLLALVSERMTAGALGLDRVPPEPVSAPASLPPPNRPPREDAADDAWAGAGEDAAEGEGEGGLLLVVDDDPANRDVLARRLKRQGHWPVTVSSGAEALAALADQPFDVILLDIMMPEMDGYETLSRIKDDARTAHLPVIMISALDDLDTVVRCIEMGAADYLSKPFDPILLRARVGASLREKRGRDRESLYTRELGESYRRLQHLERLRDDLTHMIVHDLRTPLTSVMSGLQTLPLAGDLNETQAEVLEIAVSGGQTLLNMINDLLDVEKMEQQTVPLERVPLGAASLIADAVAQIALLAQSRGLVIVQEVQPGLPAFSGDEDKLRRSLVNLLGNAIKFSAPAGTVIASVAAAEDGLLFSVRDEGEGIPPESIGRIFEKFGQVEGRKAGRRMSTGLGLTFCKLAVEAHGGRIWVESEPGRGSAFFFTIPLTPPA